MGYFSIYAFSDGYISDSCAKIRAAGGDAGLQGLHACSWRCIFQHSEQRSTPGEREFMQRVESCGIKCSYLDSERRHGYVARTSNAGGAGMGERVSRGVLFQD